MTSDSGRGAGQSGHDEAAPSSVPGSVRVLHGGPRTRLVLTGEIDAELGPDLVEAATQAQDAARPVEVDAQHVTFMDSTGVAFLAKLAARVDGTLVLIKPPELVRFLLQITSVGGLLHVVDEDPGIDGSSCHPATGPEVLDRRTGIP